MARLTVEETEARLWDEIGAKPHELRATLSGGTNIRVQEVGEGPPVLFVHGGATAGSSWAPLAARLSSLRCLLLDRPGAGGSQPIGPMRHIGDVEAMGDRLVADVLDALDVPTAHLVATSMGAYYAIRSAAAHADRVERMVLYGWPMGTPMDRVPPIARMGGVPGAARMTARMPMPRAALKIALRQFGMGRALKAGGFSDAMLDWMHALLRDTDTQANDVRALPDVWRLRGQPNPRILHTDETLARLTMPVRCIWGDEDPNGGEARAREFVARLPDAELVMVEEAGHAAWVDEPDHCADLTREFLAV